MNSDKLIAVLDANVLYPAPLRDFLLRLAEADIFIPKWSDMIHDEWIRNLLSNRKDLKKVQLSKVQQAMDGAFPEANVTGFKSIIPSVDLPDKNDRHVLAVAIKCEADLIITFNKKDFPLKVMYSLGVNVKNPDEFVVHCLQVNLPNVLHAFSNQVKALRNPPQTNEQVLNTLKNCGLSASVEMMKDYLN